MRAGCESWPITVTLLAPSSKGESGKQSWVGMIRSVQSTRKECPVSANQRDCQTARPLNYENREEIVVYQQNALVLFRGKHTIFELTHMVKTASCRPYPEKLSGL